MGNDSRRSVRYSSSIVAICVDHRLPPPHREQFSCISHQFLPNSQIQRRFTSCFSASLSQRYSNINERGGRASEERKIDSKGDGESSSEQGGDDGSTEVEIKAAIRINIICRIIMKHVIWFSSDKSRYTRRRANSEWQREIRRSRLPGGEKFEEIRNWEKF